MTAPFTVGERLRVRALPAMSKKPAFRVGDLVTVERVSAGGNLIVSGHGGYFKPVWFEREAAA